MTALSSNEGEFATSTTTWAPATASATPCPVTVLTPESGDAATSSWPFCRSLLTTFRPMRPVPPMTTIFMICSIRYRPHQRDRGERKMGAGRQEVLVTILNLSWLFVQRTAARRRGADGDCCGDQRLAATPARSLAG